MKKKVSKPISVLKWIDEHALLIVGAFLLAFIPLYPKLPLFEAIPGYIVRVRLEDMLMVGAVALWGIQVLRKKIDWKTPLTVPILLYAMAGLLSLLSGTFLTHTIPFELIHFGKSALHYFRYLEYFSLFFITFSAVKTVKHIKIMFTVIVVTLLLISIYGYGQRHWYWPVYSTMNREFSKGVRLYLTEHARVQSTFGGHYDLGGYLVLILPMVLAAAHLLKKKWQQYASWIIFIAGVWLLVLTASRTSFVAYLAGALLVVAILAWKQRTFVQKLLFSVKNGFGVTLITAILMLSFGSDMYERLMQALESYPQAYDFYHQMNGKRKEFVQYVPKLLGLKEPEIPKNSMSTDDLAVLVASDERPVPEKPSGPSDVYVNVPVTKTVATVSAEGVTSYVEVQEERTYSDNALKHGLSLAIRLDTLWPRALQGFYNNPLFGSGYATLTKEAVGQFTEAESTDNNFLRTLGETGLFGFITFYGAMLLVMLAAWKSLKYIGASDSILEIFAIGFIAGTFGLMLNAVYIDIFAASKVAFVYWGLSGITVKIFTLNVPKEKWPKFLSTSTYLPKKLPKIRSKRS